MSSGRALGAASLLLLVACGGRAELGEEDPAAAGSSSGGGMGGAPSSGGAGGAAAKYDACYFLGDAYFHIYVTKYQASNSECVVAHFVATPVQELGTMVPDVWSFDSALGYVGTQDWCWPRTLRQQSEFSFDATYSATWPTLGDPDPKLSVAAEIPFQREVSSPQLLQVSGLALPVCE